MNTLSIHVNQVFSIVQVAVKKLTAQDLDEEILADFRREVDIMYQPDLYVFVSLSETSDTFPFLFFFFKG